LIVPVSPSAQWRAARDRQQGLRLDWRRVEKNEVKKHGNPMNFNENTLFFNQLIKSSNFRELLNQ
jgi:hypothetical protein